MEGEVVVNGMEWFTTAMTHVTSTFETAIDLMTSNPLISIFLAVPVVGIGFAIYNKARNAAN